MIILDTNVISETMQPVPSDKVMDWWSRQSALGEAYTTTVSMAEILYGIEILPRGRRYATLLAGAEKMLGAVFAGRILSFDEESARLFAQIAAKRRAQGRPISELDAQIAAIAQSHSAALATRNTADFEGCGLRLINPWLA
jgi:toxin FitB